MGIVTVLNESSGAVEGADAGGGVCAEIAAFSRSTPKRLKIDLRICPDFAGGFSGRKIAGVGIWREMWEIIGLDELWGGSFQSPCRVESDPVGKIYEKLRSRRFVWRFFG